MERRGVALQGERLRYVSDATTVQVRDREVLVSDGPFAETKEQIAGYDVVECSSLAEAIEVAAKHPVARFGAVEIRPFNPGGWWRSADRRGPGDGPEYLMIHCVDETAPLDPADDCEVPGSAAARAQQAWDDETYARGLKLAGGRLQPASTARTVRGAGHRRAVRRDQGAGRRPQRARLPQPGRGLRDRVPASDRPVRDPRTPPVRPGVGSAAQG
jgi:hypothetical protein